MHIAKLTDTPRDIGGDKIPQLWWHLACQLLPFLQNTGPWISLDFCLFVLTFSYSTYTVVLLQMSPGSYYPFLPDMCGLNIFIVELAEGSSEDEEKAL